MTTKPTEAHCATPATTPLALKSNDVFGPNAQVVAWAYRRAGATYIQLTDPGPIPNQDVAPVEWCRPLVFGVYAADLHDTLRSLYTVLRDRHHGRMPEEVQAAYDKAGDLLRRHGA